MFVGKARSLPYSGAPEKFFKRPTNIRLERLSRDKHLSLL
jgi:hypothetical protein